MMSTKGLLRYDVKAKKLVYRNQKTEKQLGDFFKIIAEELSFTKPEQMEKLFKSNPDRALDFVCKELGQFATIELLTDHYVKMHNEITKQGRSVNIVQELIPKIKTRAYKVKELASKLGQDKSRDNVLMQILIH